MRRKRKGNEVVAKKIHFKNSGGGRERGTRKKREGNEVAAQKRKSILDIHS